ncbi:MAG: DUF3098 domain-containing protein [Mangrovibacterium sp.]
MLFSRKKYFGLMLCLVLLTLGFLLMSGPKNELPEQFNEDIFSFRRITLAPFLILAAYGELIYVMMKKQKTTCPDKK